MCHWHPSDPEPVSLLLFAALSCMLLPFPALRLCCCSLPLLPFAALCYHLMPYFCHLLPLAALCLYLLPFAALCCYLLPLAAYISFGDPCPGLTCNAVTAGLVVDACNGFRWPEDVDAIIKLLSTILADTANVQVVVLLPDACSLSHSQWITNNPPRMSK